MGKAKQHFTASKLCKGLPPQFQTYLDYCSKMTFEQAADFDYLKYLVLQMAEDAKINIFDNVFDWTILLTKKEISSNPLNNNLSFADNFLSSSRGANSGRPEQSAQESDRRPPELKKFRFRTYEDVKQIIYRAYNRNQPKKKAAASQQKTPAEKRDPASKLIKEEDDEEVKGDPNKNGKSKSST